MTKTERHAKKLAELEAQLTTEREKRLEAELEEAIEKSLRANPDRRPLAVIDGPAARIKRSLSECQKTIAGLEAEIPKRRAILAELDLEEAEKAAREKFAEAAALKARYDEVIEGLRQRYLEFLIMYVTLVPAVEADLAQFASEAGALAVTGALKDELEDVLRANALTDGDSKVPASIAVLTGKFTSEFHVRDLEALGTPEANQAAEAIKQNPDLIRKRNLYDPGCDAVVGNEQAYVLFLPDKPDQPIPFNAVVDADWSLHGFHRMEQGAYEAWITEKALEPEPAAEEVAPTPEPKLAKYLPRVLVRP